MNHDQIVPIYSFVVRDAGAIDLADSKMSAQALPAFRFDMQEVNGAFGDLGTLLPLALACISLAGLSSTQVLLGFGLFYVATGLIYRLPVPVQPMKAIVAVVLASEVSSISIALSGVMIGIALLILGGSGLIDRIGRLVPQSVLSGLQLGLGLGLGWIALGLMRDAPLLGLVSLLLVVLLLRARTHAAIGTLGAGVVLGYFFDTGAPMAFSAETAGFWFPDRLPTSEEFNGTLLDLALPQMALTLTNAVLLTSLVAQDRFGQRAAIVTPRRLCMTSGAANLLLAPLGALPMCHGAGGLAAHHRFGARTGGAPLIIGGVLAILAVLPVAWKAGAIAALPAATLGALLLVAAYDLAASRRLLDCKPSCRPVIAVTAVATLLATPLAGLFAGTLAELIRKAVLKHVAIASGKDGT